MAATVKKRFSIALDIADAGANRNFTVVDGDSGNELAICLTDRGYPVDLTGCRVIAVFSKANGTSAQDSGVENGGVVLCGALNNEVDIALYPASTAPGMVECELQVYSNSDLSTLVTTAKFNFACRKSIMDDDTVAALPQFPLLSELMQRVNAMQGELETAVERANAAAASCEQAVDGSIDTWQIIRYTQEG